MIKILIVCFCFLLVQDEPVMSWNESLKLSWGDFKGAPKPRVSAAAVTASGITFGFSITTTNTEVINFSTEVHAHFYPEQSWYAPEKANAHVLRHEQLHFDITELYARKFRYRLSKLKVSDDIKNKLKALQKNINAELKVLQNKYDTETDYSRNFEAQARWKSYIAAELKKLSKYKSN